MLFCRAELQAFYAHESCRQGVDDVACHHPVLTQALRGDVARQAVYIHPDAACFLMAVSLSEEGEDDAGQHISTASSSHAWVARRVEEAGSFRGADRTVGTFDDDIDLLMNCQLTCALQLLVVVACVADQSKELFLVRCEYALSWQLLDPASM